MADRIMFVDDDKNILASFKRQFKKHFDVSIAENGKAGLFFLDTEGPFAVIVSDYRMPVMDGIAFFKAVTEKAPDTIRILLTGNADLQIAMKAVNEGNIFRFLTKDSSPQYLINGLLEGIKQYRLHRAERELLEGTLRGSIQILTELLSMASPEAFGRAARIKPLVVDIARKLGVTDTWRVETAAMLSHIGCLILNPDIVLRRFRGETLSEAEAASYQSHPAIAAELLARIPRMEDIAELIAYQNAAFRNTDREKSGEGIPLIALVLKAVLYYDQFSRIEQSAENAVSRMATRSDQYDPSVVDALKAVLNVRGEGDCCFLKVDQLAVGMVLDQDIVTTSGILLIPHGKEISEPILKRLQMFVENGQIQEPIRTLNPAGAVPADAAPSCSGAPPDENP